MQQTKQKIPAINLESRLLQLTDHKQVQQMEQQHQLQQDIINHELFKTATFFDPEPSKDDSQKGETNKFGRSIHQQPAISISYSPRDTFKSPDVAVNSQHNQYNSITSSNGIIRNTQQQKTDSPKESVGNERSLGVPQLPSNQQGLHSASNRKRPLLAFKLSPSSTRSHQQNPLTDEKKQENDFDFIQSVQDAEFWNKVNMIISENEENSNNNKQNPNQGRLVSLPAINQKGEIYKKNERIFKKKLASNHISHGWEMGSSCSTRDSLRQNQSQFTPPMGQQHSYNQQQQSQSQQQKQLLQFSQSAAALKKSQNPHSLSINTHLNQLPNQKHLMTPSSVNLKNSITSPQQQQNQHSFQLDSLRTEESAHIFSPESKSYASPSTDSFNPSGYSEQLSTNANSNSTVSGAPTLGQSQSMSFFNSQVSQSSHNQPYFSNNLIMRSKSPSHEQSLAFSQNFYSNSQQPKGHSDELGRLLFQNQYSSLPNQQSERLPQREGISYPSIIQKNNNNIHLPLKYGSLQQQRAKRDSYLSPSQSSQNEFLPSSSSKKNISIQSHKLLHTFKNEDPNNIVQADSRKKSEQKQNNLLKESMIAQLNTSVKRNQQQYEQIPSPRERIGTYASQNLHCEQFDNYQFLKCNEDISHPVFSNIYSQHQSHRSYTNQDEAQNSNQFQKAHKFTQLSNKIDDPLRRSMCNNGQTMKNDFSFCDDGSNNLMKISQSAQGYREQAKKMNLRSKQQENLVKKLFKIEDKSQVMSSSVAQNNYFNSEIKLNSSKQQKLLTHQ